MACIFALVMVAPAGAQTCGDATDDDNVTVTDGVQALRAAAGLSSSCEDGCDVDGSGSVTVTDGVNVLRKAAGLSVNEACEFTAQEANGVVDPSLSIFGGMTKIPGVSSNAFVAADGCDNDGTIEITTTQSVSSATFTNCRLRGAILDGTIARGIFAQGVVVAFDGYQVKRVKTGEVHTINGQLGINDTQGLRRLAGTLNVTSSKRGAFTIQLVRVVLAGDGSVVDGQVNYDLSKTTGGKIDRIQLDFTVDPAIARVRLRNGQVKQFELDPNTGLLLPAV